MSEQVRSSVTSQIPLVQCLGEGGRKVLLIFLEPQPTSSFFLFPIASIKLHVPVLEWSSSLFLCSLNSAAFFIFLFFSCFGFVTSVLPVILLKVREVRILKLLPINGVAFSLHSNMLITDRIRLCS